MTLFLNRELDTNEKECFVLAVLNGLYTNKQTTLYVSINEIGYFATGRFLDSKKDKTIVQGIKQGLRSLADRGIIEIIDTNKDEFILSPKGLSINIKKIKFLTVEQWEIQKIFKNTAKPFNLFKFFTQIVARINTNTKACYMSHEEMIKLFGGSRSTLVSYIRKLEELELLYTYRPYRKRKDGTFRNINNTYGRYADRNAVKESALSYIATIDSIEISKDLDRRSIKARYNHFISGSRKYQHDLDEVKRLYGDCIKYNKSLEYNPIEGGYGENKEFKQGGQLDLSVFPEWVKDEDDDYDDEDEWGNI